MARAVDDLDFARDAGRQGTHAIAISRSYYAALYASMALLASVGMHAKTHDGVRTLVNQHFVRTGKLPTETSMHLGQIEGARYEADYDLAALFTAESANEIVERAALTVTSDASRRLLAAPRRDRTGRVTTRGRRCPR